MIATHNIKVNGKWYRAGEMVPDPEPKQAEIPVEAVKEEPVAEAKVPEEPKEEAAPQLKPRTTSRRKK